jgi:hypothetical protein
LKGLAVEWPTRIHRGVPKKSIADITIPLRGLAVHELLAWSAELEIVEPVDIRAEVSIGSRPLFAITENDPMEQILRKSVTEKNSCHPRE